MTLLERHGYGIRGAFALTIGVIGAACSLGETHVWVDQAPRSAMTEASGEYLISSGDVIGVRVYNQDGISTRARVRPDGRIAVPLVGEIEALGRRPTDLAREIEARLKPFVLAPSVTIGVEEVQPLRVSVVGEVARPGVYGMEPKAGVLEALAAAGGMTEFADKDRIFVVRKQAEKAPLRIRFSYAKLVGGSQRAAAFVLLPGDVVSIE